MVYKKILVYTEKTDEASGLLIMLGAAGTEVISQSEDDLLCFNFDYIDIEKPVRSGVAAYFEDNDSFEQRCYDIVSALRNAGFSDIEISDVDTASYENEWKKYLKPVELSSFVVVPMVDGVDGDLIENKERIVIIPGRAFGTGMHETTRLCIELLTKYVKDGCAVADIGTGSGILAIAAKKLGAGDVCGVDNDPDAIENAEANMRINSVNIRLDCADLASTISGAADIIVANIAVKAVVALAEDVRCLLAPNGLYICSGIIFSEKENTRCALQSLGYEVVEVAQMGEWCAFAARLICGVARE